MSAPTALSIWKTIKLGTGLKTVDDFARMGVRMSGLARKLMEQKAFTIAAEPFEGRLTGQVSL
jgi:hypothetical protein